MIISKQQTFSDAQALTATAASTNIIDLGPTGTVLGAPAALLRDIGKGVPIPIHIALVVAAGGTSPVLDVDLQMDTTSAFSSATTVARLPAQLAGGAAGLQLKIFWIPEGTFERYLRLNYTLGGTTPTYTLDAMIVLSEQTND